MLVLTTYKWGILGVEPTTYNGIAYAQRYSLAQLVMFVSFVSCFQALHSTLVDAYAPTQVRGLKRQGKLCGQLCRVKETSSANMKLPGYQAEEQ